MLNAKNKSIYDMDVGKKIYTFGFVQLGRQQLVLLRKLFMLRKEFLEKLCPSIGAKLMRE